MLTVFCVTDCLCKNNKYNYIKKNKFISIIFQIVFELSTIWDIYE